MKPNLVHVTDPETIAAIERNGFGDPIPVAEADGSYWVDGETLRQYRSRRFIDCEFCGKSHPANMLCPD